MITARGRRVRAISVAISIGLAALLLGYSTGDRCYPTFSAGSCLRMIDQSVQVGK